eukprot:13386572-Alexandrium_andersonii.AAC.1
MEVRRAREAFRVRVDFPLCDNRPRPHAWQKSGHTWHRTTGSRDGLVCEQMRRGWTARRDRAQDMRPSSPECPEMMPR